MTTCAILIQDALCQRGVLADDVAPSTPQLNTGLRWLQRMLDSWANEFEMIYSSTTETFTMVASTASYTTASFASGNGRPVGIDSITLVSSNVTYTVDIVDSQTYNSVAYKPVDAIPTICYYDEAYPIATFYFYPRPYTAFTANIEVLRPLSGTLATSTDLLLPRGYEKAIVDNLCVYMNYGNPVTPEMTKAANESRNVLKRKNYVPLLMETAIDSGYSVSNDFPYSGF